MLTPVLIGVFFAATYLGARRSLRTGLCVLFTIGYAYGIVRANRMDGFSHLLFDASLLGLYAAQIQRAFSLEERVRLDTLRTWLFVMIGWPVVLFFTPTQDILVELVGLRGNVFMLPCMLIGARLQRSDLAVIGLWFAVLNIAAAGVAAVQFIIGIEPFFPQNAVTELLYRSRDIAGYTAHRIPSTFSGAHAFGAMMVATLPALFGAWFHFHGARRSLVSIAIAASVLSVFTAGARTPVVLLLVLGVVVVFSSHVRLVHKMRWLFVAAAVAYVVSGEERMQRFLTLRDPDFLTERIGGSVNLGLLDIASQYPLGNGLGGGGTSIPYFLQDRVRNVVTVENEFGRILLEQGIPGLIMWLLFLLWVFTRRTNLPGQPWFMARRLAWVWCALSTTTAVLGTGMLTSIPGTALFLIMLGWIAVPESAEDLEAAAARAPIAYELA